MNKPLSRRQAEALEFIKSFVKQHGYSPSVREIAASMRWASSSTAQHCLDALQAKGFINRENGGPRTIRLLKAAMEEQPLSEDAQHWKQLYEHEKELSEHEIRRLEKEITKLQEEKSFFLEAYKDKIMAEK